LVSVDRQEPKISARVVTQAGSSRDPVGFLGAAHALEHLLANKGTRRLGTRDAVAERPHLDRVLAAMPQVRDNPALMEALRQAEAAADAYAVPNELKQIYTQLGASRLNATTSLDRTAFQVELPSPRLEAWARLESDRLLDPVFRGVRTELQTIVQEKLRALDDPRRALYGASMGALYGGHPYERDVLGSLEHLESGRVDLLRAFWEQGYGPSQLAVILCGDLDEDRTLALVEQHFGQLPARPPPWGELPEPGPVASHRVEVVHQADDEVWLCYRLPPGDHPDMEALILADTLLANGATGLLDTALVQTQRVRRAGSSLRSMRAAGTLVVSGTPREGQTVEQVEALLLEQVDALCTGAGNADRLAELIQAFRIGEAVGLERSERRAGVLVHAVARGLDPHFVRGRLDRMAELGPQVVVDAARRWLTQRPVVAIRRRGDPGHRAPETPAVASRTLADTGHSAFFEQVLAMPAAPLEPQRLEICQGPVVDGQIERVETPSGVAFRAPNPLNDVAQVTMRVGWGHRHHPPLEQAMGVWGRTGTADLDLEALNAALFKLGVSLRLGGSAWHTDVTLHGPEHALEQGVALARARLVQPVLSPQVWDRHLDDQLHRRAEQKATPAVRGWALSVVARFGSDSVHLERGSDAELRALPLPQVLAQTASLLELERSVYAVGAHDAAWFDALFGGPATRPVPERRPRRFVRPVADRVLVMPSPGAQVQLGVLVPSEVYDPARVPVYKLLAGVLGGSDGLTFQTVREARGLAYSAGAQYDRGGLPGHDNLLRFVAGVAPQQVIPTVTLLLELLRDTPLDPSRFARAQRAAIQGVRAERTRFRSRPHAAHSWLLRGLPGDPRAGWLSELERLQASDLEALWAPLRQTPVTVTVLGDLEGLDLDALAQLGDVQVLDLDALLPY
jgi:predicted Zn-dependent peptidase